MAAFGPTQSHSARCQQVGGTVEVVGAGPVQRVENTLDTLGTLDSSRDTDTEEGTRDEVASAAASAAADAATGRRARVLWASASAGSLRISSTAAASRRGPTADMPAEVRRFVFCNLCSLIKREKIHKILS